MVTRLLNLCGLTLGPTKDLLRARPSNPEGFWENRSFIRLNDAILQELGGTWDDPPRSLPPSWESGAALGPLAERALKLLRPFRRCEPWGWKDPRNCLTLPFWKRMLPDLRVLLCVRNPLAVAGSLRLRDDTTCPEAIGLWLTYNRHALQALPPGRWVVTHYESYFSDPRAELRRVLTLLELPFQPHDLEQACGTIRPTLIHHRASEDDLSAAGAPDEVLSCYRSLCQQAGFPEPTTEEGTGPAHCSQENSTALPLYKHRAAG
jgi:hypothetical protein